MDMPPDSYLHATLPNGLRVSYYHHPDFHSTTVNVFIGSGSRHDRSGLEGELHMLEHAVFLGTQKYPNTESLSRAVGRHGAELNAGTSKECTNFHVEVPCHSIAVALDVLQQLVWRPLLPAAKICKERIVVGAECIEQAHQPLSDQWLLFFRSVFPSQGMSHDELGKPSTLRRLTSRRMRESWERHYTVENAHVLIAGNLQSVPPRLCEDILGYFDLPHGDLSHRLPLYVAAPGCFHKQRARSRQSSVWVASILPDLSYQDKVALGALVEMVHGEGVGSPLFNALRGRESLVYDATINFGHLTSGLCVMRFATETSRTHVRRVIDHYWETIDRVVSDQERFDYAHQRRLARFDMQFPSSEYMATNQMVDHVTDGSWQTLVDSRSALVGVTFDDVRRLAQRCRPDQSHEIILDV